MATLDYIEIPPGATRLLSPSPSSSASSSPTTTDIRPLPKISTRLPNPSPPSTPPPLRRRTISASTALSLNSSPSQLGGSTVTAGLTSPTLSFLPQLLLSSSLPSGVLPSSPKKPTNGAEGKQALLSSRDPLSLPIMTNNFKRFVAKVGPVFWLQDRVEEVLFWRRGWRVTGVWMAAYAFLCYFPRMILLLPHLALIAIILSTYRYPPQAHSSSSGSTVPPPPPPVASTTEDWQANIQAIQNLMGLYADLHAQVTPYLTHLQLSPVGAFTPAPTSTTTSTTGRGSACTPHILTLLLLTLPPLAFLVSLPAFPIKAVALVIGWTPFAITHPWTQAVLPHLSSVVSQVRPTVVNVWNGSINRWNRVQIRLKRYTPWLYTWLSSYFTSNSFSTAQGVKGGNIEERALSLKHLKMALRRWMDNERLTDKCWNSEMREVELWENERLAGDPGTFSKSHLKPNERGPWTRGRDGWSGMGVGGVEEVGVGVGGMGEVSSNLTFSLAPGWAFVDTEDWRKDLDAGWIDCGADEDGWVYTNDAWLGPRPTPYTSNGGSVTRRRRWLRRVYFDPVLAAPAAPEKLDRAMSVDSVD